MKFLLLTLLVFQFNILYCQVFPDKEKDRIFKTDRYATYSLNLDSGISENIFLKGINTIEIVDARADTLVIGYFKKGLLNNLKKIRFATPGLSELVKYSKKLISPAGTDLPYDLLLAVKELWLTEEDSDKDDKEKILDADEKIYPSSNIKVTFDFYLRASEKYYPLYRFDTILTRTLPLKSYITDYIKNALALSLGKIPNYDLPGIVKIKSPLTWSGIQNYNESRFRFPILKDSSFNKGVYVSFEEFRNNHPSLSEFQIQRGKLGDELYTLSENGKWLVSRSVWGYCDGNTVFIKSGDNYFQLVRIENSFYFNGSKGISRAEIYNYNIYGGYTRSGNKSYANVLTPFKLNVETGLIY